MSFEHCEGINLRHSVPFQRVGILGEMGLVISYFIDVMLFRKI